MNDKNSSNKPSSRLLKLKDLQLHFSQSLLYQDSEITSQLKDKEGFSSDQLLQIHRNNFVVGVTDSLKITYSYTLQLVGDEFFESVARQFILQTPPVENNICVYGEGFSNYLTSLQQLNEMPYIAEMAKFEWLYERTQNLPLQQTRFDVISLQEVEEEDFEKLQFSIVSDCITFTSQQNIYLLFNMIKNNNVEDVNISQPCFLLLKKNPNFTIEVIELSEPQWQLIQQLQKQTTLGSLEPSRLQEQLSDLLTLNLISGFTVNNTKDEL